MNAVMSLAMQEIRIATRNRWVFAAFFLMFILAGALSLLGSAPTGSVSVDALSVLTVSLSSLSVFLVPLIALLISYDTIVGEVETGTMLLLLSYPLSRTSVVLGKFLGQFSVICFAVLFGFGLAALLLVLTAENALGDTAIVEFILLLVSSMIMGGMFLALGLVISAGTSQRGAAAGIAFGAWFFFVIVFDLVLLGALVAGLDASLSEDAFSAILLANPTDIFRMLNVGSAGGDAALLSGTAGLSGNAGITPSVLWTSLVLWMLVPLGAAIALFRKKEI